MVQLLLLSCHWGPHRLLVFKYADRVVKNRNLGALSLQKKSETSTKPLALIIDDEKAICSSLAGVLEDEGWRTVTANSGKQGMIEYKLNAPDIVLLDVWMPGGMDGIETLQKLKEIREGVPVVIMSGHATIETAVKATKLGAFDFLEKPLSIEKLLPMIGHARQLRATRDKSLEVKERTHTLIGISSAIEATRKLIKVVAPRNSWVLITGENGTGKEVVAHNIHLHSARSNKAFIAVNCAAIPEELIESELFGHAKGAFTNAIALKRGRFELANDGTLFLDEIGDMSLKTQAKILRLLQEQKFERLGDDASIDVDVRVIAATNKDLQEEIKKGNFREDLFYRLNVIPFVLAPLRDRREDVPVLAEHFLSEMAVELKEPLKRFTEEAIEILQSYAWPGNIRELRNLVERLTIMIPGAEIQVNDLPDSVFEVKDLLQQDSGSIVAPGTSLKQAKSDFEKSFILDRLHENNWNVSKTADAIGIERSNLHKKLRGYGIDPKRLKGD